MRAGIIAAGWGKRLGQKLPKALTAVGGRALIDYTLDGLQHAGVTEVTCIINEASTDIRSYVDRSGRPLKMDWIVKTTPSSMHSFLTVLERMSETAQDHYLMTTVDSVTDKSQYATFLMTSRLFNEADVVLGLTSHIRDEKPLRVAMKGDEGTGLIPEHVAGHTDAFEIVAMTNTGFDSDYVTSGFYYVGSSILKRKDEALAAKFTALRQYLGDLLKFGYRFYGVPLPPIVDVDRPEDIHDAEALLSGAALPSSSAVTGRGSITTS